jgi:pimeloyl-ACP methyl ester carboxylesterase
LFENSPDSGYVVAEMFYDEPAPEYLRPTSAFASVDGMQLHYTRSGSGPAIVLLHGSGASLHIFNEIVETLEARFEVICLDLPGFGLTGPRPDRDYSIEAYVSSLRDFLDQNVPGPFVLGGHSLGGQIAWTYALRPVGRLRGLVLMNATGYPEKTLPTAFKLARNPVIRPFARRWGSRSAIARSLAAIVGPGSDAVDDAMIDRVHALTSRPGNRGAFVDLANTDQADRSREISTIAAPTLILSSDLVDGQHFARDVRGCCEVRFEGVGHLMPAEAPRRTAKAIAGFVDSLATHES